MVIKTPSSAGIDSAINDWPKMHKARSHDQSLCGKGSIVTVFVVIEHGVHLLMGGLPCHSEEEQPGSSIKCQGTIFGTEL